jgi:hypothetical protein
VKCSLNFKLMSYLKVILLGKSRHAVEWNDVELFQMIYVDEMSYLKVQITVTECLTL